MLLFFIIKPSLAEPPGEREGSDVAEHVAPGIGNLIAQPGSVDEARDRPLRNTHSDVPCSWLILRSCPSGVGLSAP